MDFELLSESEPRTFNPLHLFERLLTHRRRHWQLWAETPPHTLGTLLLLTVALEMTVAIRLFHNQGAGSAVAGHFVGVLFLIVLAELLVLTIGSKGAELVGKRGNFFHGMTFLNMSLAPLLLYLPISLACWMAGRESFILFRFLALFLLAFRVISHWKEAVEVTYKLTKIQSALVMYAVFGVATTLTVIFLYASLINNLTSALS